MPKYMLIMRTDGRALPGPDRPGRFADPARGPGPAAVGLLGDPPWARRAGQGVDSWPRPLRPAGRDRRRPRVGALRRGD
jgi:hypothetical protein